MTLRYFLITGSDGICEIVEQAELLKAVHDMFCCCGADTTCDNCYLEAFKEEYKDGVDFEGWKENLEDGWLRVEELPEQPKQLAELRAESERIKGTLKGMKASIETLPWEDRRPQLDVFLKMIDAALADQVRQKETP